ncbi:transglutaminase-like domain-containing protein [Myxococcota bacterium]|nr:transglutaminase-like domain-containing protein [Myxococcota bacterium]
MSSRPRLPALEAVIVFAWAAVMAALFLDGRPVAGPTSPRFDLGSLPVGAEERWMGIYAQGAKVGTSVAATWELPDGGLALREHTALRLVAFEQVRSLSTTASAELDPDLRARTFAFLMDGGETSFRAEGRREGDGFVVAFASAGAAPSELRLEAPPILAGVVLRAMAREGRLRGGLAVGQRFTVPFFDPATRGQRDAAGEVVATTPEGLFEVRYSIAGAESVALVDAEGEIYRDSGLLGMEIRREEREVALGEGWASGRPPDLIALSAIPIDREIPDARRARRLVLAVVAPAAVGDLLAAAHGEAWKGGRLEVAVPRVLGTYPIPLVDPRHAPWLAAEPGVEVDDPAIRAQAGRVLGEVLDAREAVRLINRYVYSAVAKSPSLTVPSAKETLRTLEGDCNEHTALFTALARASGIPTRIAAGFVYSDRIAVGGAFYYHAWPEVWLGDGWLPVDPTFGQVPADATHVKLVEGGLDRQVDLVAAIGRVSLRVEEVE